MPPSRAATPARLEESAERASSRYDVTFLCGADIPYDDTWDRSSDANRAETSFPELRRRTHPEPFTFPAPIPSPHDPAGSDDIF